MSGLTTRAICAACGTPLAITPDSLPACPSCFLLHPDEGLVSVAYNGEALLDEEEGLETLSGNKKAQTEWKKRMYYEAIDSLLDAMLGDSPYRIMPYIPVSFRQTVELFFHRIRSTETAMNPKYTWDQRDASAVKVYYQAVVAIKMALDEANLAAIRNGGMLEASLAGGSAGQAARTGNGASGGESSRMASGSTATSANESRKSTSSTIAYRADGRMENLTLPQLFDRTAPFFRPDKVRKKPLHCLRHLAREYKKYATALGVYALPAEVILCQLNTCVHRLRRLAKLTHDQRLLHLRTKPRRDWEVRDWAYFRHPKLDWDAVLSVAWGLYQAAACVRLWEHSDRKSIAVAVSLCLWACQALVGSPMPAREALSTELCAQFEIGPRGTAERQVELRLLITAWSTSILDAGLAFPLMPAPVRGPLGDGLSGYAGDGRRGIPEPELACTAARTIGENWKALATARLTRMQKRRQEGLGAGVMDIQEETILAKRTFAKMGPNWKGVKPKNYEHGYGHDYGNWRTSEIASKAWSGRQGSVESSRASTPYSVISSSSAGSVYSNTSSRMTSPFPPSNSAVNGPDTFKQVRPAPQWTAPPASPPVEDLLLRDDSSAAGDSALSSDDEMLPVSGDRAAAKTQIRNRRTTQALDSNTAQGAKSAFQLGLETIDRQGGHEFVIGPSVFASRPSPVTAGPQVQDEPAPFVGPSIPGRVAADPASSALSSRASTMSPAPSSLSLASASASASRNSREKGTPASDTPSLKEFSEGQLREMMLSQGEAEALDDDADGESAGNAQKDEAQLLMPDDPGFTWAGCLVMERSQYVLEKKTKAEKGKGGASGEGAGRGAAKRRKMADTLVDAA